MANVRTKIAYLVLAGILVLAISCNFQRQADEKFGDQNFKSAIALIELHKVRFGEYPASLKDLKYLGDWDQLYLGGVEYKRLDNGYELNLTRGWVGNPELKYPADFWQGLGIVRSNVKRGE